MNLNIMDAQSRDEMCQTISIRVDDYCEAQETKQYRAHLGASQIGEPCARKLFYDFRWCTEVKLAVGLDSKGWTAGQMARLLQRGDMEEDRATHFLQSVGLTVYPNDPQTGKQWKFTNLEGHFEGSIDAFAKLPPEFNYDKLITVSYKTMNDKNFNELKKERSIKAVKPQYYYQESTYAYQFNTEYALYYVVNKNNDKNYYEIVPMHKQDGEMMLRKANDVINCDPMNPPQRIAMRPTDFACKYCSHKNICHYNEPVRKNCRSCIHSRPAAQQQWVCNLKQCVIGPELIQIGCEAFQGIH